MKSKENDESVFFSTFRDDGQGDGYGPAVIWLRIRDGHKHLQLDDEFPTGEQHFRFPAYLIGGHNLVRNGIVIDDEPVTHAQHEARRRPPRRP